MSFSKEQISKTIANFGSGVRDSLNMIDHGLIVDTTHSLYPLSKHRSERIFSVDGLMNFFVEEDRIDYTTQVVRDQTEANSAYELFKKFETKVTATGSFGVGVSFSATAAAEYSYTRNTKENVRFAQLKLVCEVATIDMPEGLELRALLEPSFLEALDNVSSMAEATNLVKRFGAVYVSDATWGGSLSLTTSSQKTETTSTTNLLASLEAEMKSITSSASTSVSTSDGETTSSIQDNFKYTMVGIGGIPSLVNDEAAWMDSVGLNPAVVEIKVSSIAELALPGSVAKGILEEAVIAHSAQYEGFFDDELFLKLVRHNMKFHWKIKDLRKELDDHKIFCDKHIKEAKSATPGPLNHHGKRKKKYYIASGKKGLEYIKYLRQRLSRENRVELFLMTLDELRRQNKKRIDQSYFSQDKMVYKEHYFFIKRMMVLAKNVGALGLSNTTVSFYNERHGRFLQFDARSKILGVGKVTDATVLVDPEISEFRVKVVDKAKGYVALYNPDSDTFLSTKGNKVSCEKFDDSQHQFPTNLKFIFYAYTSGFSIQSVSSQEFIRIEDDSFGVSLTDKVGTGAMFLLRESA